MDTYYNLSYKHVMGYKWVLTFCPNADFVLKVDDDIFLDIMRWLDWRSRDLAKENPLEIPELYCKLSKNGSKPTRDISSKWDVSREEWSRKYYPSFCFGGVYGIGVPMMKRLYSVVNLVKFFWIDDIFVTGAVREVAMLRFRKWVPRVENVGDGFSLGDKNAYATLCDSDKDPAIWESQRSFGLAVEIVPGERKLGSDQKLYKENWYADFEKYMMCMWKKVLLDYFHKTGMSLGSWDWTKA